jgi:outer membrane protein assembly factor BamB
MNTKRYRIITIAIVLVTSLALPLAYIPVSNAQTSKNSFALVGALPNPVGVGQEVLLWFGITDFTTRPQLGWEGLTITVKRPDGTNETLGPFMTDTTGSSGTVYVPTMVGTYTFQTHFPEQTVTAAFPGRTQPLGTIMKASISEEYSLVVQENPITYWPGIPLPTEYWTRPIDSQFREWSTISGNWLAIPPNRYAPYNHGPETPHILWAKPLQIGGLIGGEYESFSYEHGDAYQGKWANPVIIDGKLFYNRFQLGFQGGPPQQGIIAVDLHTGQELWFRNNTRLAFGQIVYWDSFNLHGAYPYLWEVVGSTWRAYDASTGEYIFSMRNVPGGTNVYGAKGEILRYVINSAAGWMALWNSTRAVDLEGWSISDVMTETGITPAATAEFAFGSWVPFNRNIDASKHGWMWNVSIPRGLPGTAKLFMDDRIIGSNTVGAVGSAQLNPVFWGISVKQGQEGRLIFNTTWALPTPDVQVDIPAQTTPAVEDGVFIVGAKDTRKYYALSIDTGKQVWGTTVPEAALNVFSILYGGAWGASSIAYGRLFTAGMAGVVNAYDLKTGQLIWSYNAIDPYTEILWSNDWPLPIVAITDGKIYLAHQEHSVVDPRPRGAPTICLNATTGEEIWRIDGAFRTTRWGGQPIIGDSIIAAFDTYDNRIYAIGKGPSAVTVTAPDVSIELCKSLIIRGTVTDISPGTDETALRKRFSNGVPAIADEHMSEWMLYVYKQFPRPSTAIGVPVTIDVIDSNGNYRNIGTAISDSSGMFSFTWQPDIEGTYTVIATFAGSKSYWPSFAQTTFVVDPSPPSPPEQPAVELPPTEMYIIGSTVAIIIAIAIVALLLLRKRP